MNLLIILFTKKKNLLLIFKKTYKVLIQFNFKSNLYNKNKIFSKNFINYYKFLLHLSFFGLFEKNNKKEFKFNYINVYI